jgi:hypothetical protein
MLLEEKLTSVLRLYHDDAPGYRTATDVMLCVLWCSPTEVVIVAHKGEHTRKSFRELVRWLDESGVEVVRSERAGGSEKPSPCAVRGADGWDVTVVKELVARFGRPSSSARATLTSGSPATGRACNRARATD